jgi:H+/Cl- antiporter ClcA
MRAITVTPTDVFIGAVVLGVICGLLGAFFISINFKVNALRAKYQTKKWHKPIDTFMFAFATASCFFWFSYWF